MASTRAPHINAYEASAAIAKGCAVKIGSNNKTATQASAASDKTVGIAQNAPANAGDRCEVAMPGGGALGLAGGTIAAGDPLTVNGSGQLVSSTTTGDRIVGWAEESAVAGDLFSVAVGLGLHP